MAWELVLSGKVVLRSRVDVCSREMEGKRSSPNHHGISSAYGAGFVPEVYPLYRTIYYTLLGNSRLF